MSQKGILRFARAMKELQDARYDLISMGGKKPTTRECRQDLKLATLAEKAHDHVKEKFSEISAEDT